jgi:hypothetical protein
MSTQTRLQNLVVITALCYDVSPINFVAPCGRQAGNKIGYFLPRMFLFIDLHHQDSSVSSNHFRSQVLARLVLASGILESEHYAA